jgi:hypothetical protein
MNKLIISIGIAFFLILFSCKNQSSESSEGYLNLNIPKDIPTYKNGKPRSFYSNKALVETKLGLNSLENGFDSICLRFWYGYSNLDRGQLLILKNIGGKWSGQLINFQYHFNKGGDSISNISKDVQDIRPKSGWGFIVSKLKDLAIADLPDDINIQGYQRVADGNTLIIETSTKTNYRIFSYKEPSIAARTCGEAGRIVEWLNLMKEQFDYKQLQEM